MATRLHDRYYKLKESLSFETYLKQALFFLTPNKIINFRFQQNCCFPFQWSLVLRFKDFEKAQFIKRWSIGQTKPMKFFFFFFCSFYDTFSRKMGPKVIGQIMQDGIEKTKTLCRYYNNGRCKKNLECNSWLYQQGDE